MKTKPATGTDKPAERHASLSRRRFLRGLGACLALPSFASLRPWSALGAETQASAAAGAATRAPLRMAFLYFPNGAIPGNWWPAKEGNDFDLSPTLQPLEKVRGKIQVLGGLSHLCALAGSDGGGDHARANATFLTGVRADIHAGISIDQVAASQIGHLTRFPSLELSCLPVRKSGNCDSGYSCVYQHNLSWRSPTVPMSPEINPRQVFERLFGAGAPGERRADFDRRQKEQHSILDFVMEDARSLQAQLSSRDRDKLDQYLTSVRDIEKRIENSEHFGAVPEVAADTPAGIPTSFGEHIRLMTDLMVLAFQTDSTRIATLLLASDGNNRPYDEIGIPEGHHDLSHHRDAQETVRKVALIDRWYVSQFASFLERLEQTRDVDGRSLLDNSMIVYGCGNADGNRHTHENLPIILAGGGRGTLTTGRYVKLSRMPATNLFLSLADRMGVSDLERFGDSTGRLQSV
jgi:hypothetical protein